MIFFAKMVNFFVKMAKFFAKIANSFAKMIHLFADIVNFAKIANFYGFHRETVASPFEFLKKSLRTLPSKPLRFLLKKILL